MENNIEAGQGSDSTSNPKDARYNVYSDAQEGERVVTDQSVAAAIREGAATEKALENKALSVDGGTVRGDIILKTPPNTRSNRIILEAWERSNKPNNRAGDVMELHWRTPYAKPFIGWWDSTDPENPRMKAWMGAHDLPNNPKGEPHRHWSVEVSDSQGQMQSRFIIDYDKDQTNIRTSSADFSVGWGAFRLAGSSLEFTTKTRGEEEIQRWSVERSQGKRFNLTMHRHDGEGGKVAVSRMDRSTGFVALGGSFEPKSILHLKGHQNTFKVESQTRSFSIKADGEMVWDATSQEGGIRLEPSFSEAHERGLVLRNGDFRIGDASKGIIMEDQHTGTLHRIRLRKGKLRIDAL